MENENDLNVVYSQSSTGSQTVQCTASMTRDFLKPFLELARNKIKEIREQKAKRELLKKEKENLKSMKQLKKLDDLQAKKKKKLKKNKTIETVKHRSKNQKFTMKKLLTKQNKMIESQIKENQIIEDQLIDKEVIGNEMIDNQLIENQTIENQLVVNQTVNQSNYFFVCYNCGQSNQTGQVWLNQSWISCSICHKWLHLKCAFLDNLGQSQVFGTTPYVCLQCNQQKTINYQLIQL